MIYVAYFFRMYYKLRNDIIYRYYESFLYLTDNNDFSYNPIIPDNVRERIVSKTGSFFVSILGKEPKDIDSIVEKIQREFDDVDVEILKNDAIEFYDELVLAGFLDSGRTANECIERGKEDYISITKKEVPLNQEKKLYTQEFFDNTYHKPQLRSVLLELTTKCNERCIHCYIPHEYKVDLMDSDMIYDLLKKIRDMNVLNVTITGGEPMLHKEFLGLLKKCNEFNFSVNVLSNLTLLSDEIVDEMVQNKLLCVQTSLYSMDSKIHDEITGCVGSHKKTISAIEKLVKNHIPIQINCPILKNNMNEYKNVISWAEEKGIVADSDFAVFAQYNNCQSNLKCRLSNEEAEKITIDKIYNDEDYRYRISEGILRKKVVDLNKPICTVCKESICISSTGNVYPCSGWEGYSLGNVNEKDIETIWYDSRKANFLRQLTLKDFPKCINCPDRNYCTICLVKNANENIGGDPLKVNDYFCKKSHLIRTYYEKYCSEFPKI